MADNSLSSSKTVDDKFQALLSNAGAARVISQAVEGTIGPKGLDIMMVDKFGDVVISNDGVTILKMMEVNHPVARMIINTARAQQSEVGDGTTTATIIAGALVAEGAEQVIKGVPVTRVIEGISAGVNSALNLIKKQSRPVDSLEDRMLLNIAEIAGRGHKDLARLVIKGAQLVGIQKMKNHEYKFAEAIVARESAPSQVFRGVLLNKQPVNKDMPLVLEKPSILVVDDALAPEEIEREAMKSEAGFQYYLQAREKYEENLKKICALGVKMVVVDRGIDDIAEEVFTEAGIAVFQRVSSREIEKLCQHTGAKKIKRSGLNREAGILQSYLGKARMVKVDEKFEHTYVYDGGSENWTTILIGASTEEVVDERERMARDAASAVQAAVQGGIVPGGGALEVWLAAHMEEVARDVESMTTFGVLCVKEALIKPFSCLVANAGFNPLEKLGDVVVAQRKNGSDSIAIDCEKGKLIDVIRNGIVDPALVKQHAVKAAGEVAVAILRINTIIKMKDEKTNPDNTDIWE
ncbi:MAG: TCP-1/cpn60 chaperonin family protein [Syntrophomonas sp.]